MPSPSIAWPWVGLGALWAVFAAGLAWHLAHTAFAITYVTLADGRRQERRLPLVFRILLPLAPGITPRLAQAPFRVLRDRTLAALTAAGFDGVLAAEEFLALRLLTPLVGLPLLGLPLLAALAWRAGPATGAGLRLGAAAALVGLLSLAYPSWWLQQAIALRHRRILRALPFVMDLLTLSVEAGLDFMSAIKTIVERRPPDPIAEEFSRVLVEIQLGKTRREALLRLAARVQHPDVHSLVLALVQADEMGVSIGATLRIQSDQIRAKRFLQVEKLANEAPVKMLFPLVVCIFPAVFLIMLGPIVLQMLRQGV